MDPMKAYRYALLDVRLTLNELAVKANRVVDERQMNPFEEQHVLLGIVSLRQLFQREYERVNALVPEEADDEYDE